MKERVKLSVYLILVLITSMMIFSLGEIQQTSALDKEWTIMIYLDGDNNLEAAAIDDFNEMEFAGGTTDDVNVVAIFDRCAESYEYGQYPEDWSGTRYYEIQSDTDMSTINSLMVQDLGEQNMGDFDTLSTFVTWAKTNYPADKYALFLWDHGGGLDGVCWDEDNGYDYLDMYDLQRLPYSDFLCFDACVMGQMEVLYEVLNQCEYVGFSMLNVPFDGMDYTSALSALIATPTMNQEEFSEIVCQTYVDYYDGISSVSFSVYDTKDLTSIRTLIDTLSQALIDDLPAYKSDNSPADGTVTCTITIRSPTEELLIQEQGMTFNTGGIYNYTVPATNLTANGEYPTNVNCDDSSDFGFSSFTFCM